ACQQNPLSCLPFLPNTLDSLNISNTNIQCLPNIPVGIAAANTLPLCLRNNTNGCFTAARIYGNVFKDRNANCTIETGVDTLQENILVKAVDNATQQVYTTNSNAQGQYEIAVPIGNFSVSVVPPSVYWSACTAPQTVSITQNAQQEQRDVLLKADALCSDMQINHQVVNIPRPCSTAAFKVTYFNGGTISSLGTYADLTFPAELTVTSASHAYTVLGGGVIRFQLDTVAALQRDTFSVNATVGCNATLGQMLCTHAEIMPHTYCGATLSGWDGSDIAVSGRCVGQDSVRFIIKNIGASPMQTARTFGVVEDNIMRQSGSFQLAPGASDSVTVAADPHKIYRMIADEAPNNPAHNTQETFLIWGCNGSNTGIHWGFVNQYSLNTGANYEHDLCSEVRTSFDPNEISAVAGGTQLQHFIPKNTELEYTVRFQNTGNDTAFVVRILDKIPAKLDLTSFRIGTSSHPFTYSLKANGTVEFLFQRILLPDSTTNELRSHGFVTYFIKTQSNLAAGTTINNQAQIYFDTNAPVATNTYTHTIAENLGQVFLGVEPVFTKPELKLSVIPNPMHDAATFIFENTGLLTTKTMTLTLYNALGQAVRRQDFQNNQLLLQRDNLPQGCYFYSIKVGDELISRGKAVVE
ncbi:MAG: hypothetical protein RI894_858, partial [Bacteroidota bacterium]